MGLGAVVWVLLRFIVEEFIVLTDKRSGRAGALDGAGGKTAETC